MGSYHGSRSNVSMRRVRRVSYALVCAEKDCSNRGKVIAETEHEEDIVYAHIGEFGFCDESDVKD